MEKLHIKVTYGKSIGCEGTVAIMQCILIRSSGVCIKMRAINGSECILEEWEKFGVTKDEIRYGITNSWQSDVIGVKWSG
jgi:hypothetical protein